MTQEGINLLVFLGLMGAFILALGLYAWHVIRNLPGRKPFVPRKR